jgi:DNA-binding NarL/FixJ family response regulator
MPRTVLIVDDHAGFRASARRMLSSHDYDVVAEAGTGEEALEIARTLRPESVLLDIGLPDLNGIEVARRLTEAQPEVAIVLVSSHDRADLEPVLASAPARGFIAKSELSAAVFEDLIG